MADLRYLTDGSPIAAFVATCRLMVQNRSALASALNADVMGDLSMLVTDGITMGATSQWVRRVAQPMFNAQRTLDLEAGTARDRIEMALRTIDKLTNYDAPLHSACRRWIKETFDVA